MISRRIRVVVDETLHKLLIDAFMYQNSVVAVNILKREKTYEIHKESKLTSEFSSSRSFIFHISYITYYLSYNTYHRCDTKFVTTLHKENIFFNPDTEYSNEA